MSAGVGQQRVVRVLPDVAAIDKEFDYLVPDGMPVAVGDVVRIQLHGRRVGAWIVAADIEPTPGVTLKPLAKVSGRGPAPELIELASWAAWRWAGRRASFLRTAAPPGVVRSGPSRRVRPATATSGPAVTPEGPQGSTGARSRTTTIAAALSLDRGVLRLGPGADRYPLVRAAAADVAGRPARGQLLILVPSVAEAQQLGGRLKREGFAVAVVATDGPGAAATGEWARAAYGVADVVVGSRAGAWAPAPDLVRVLVMDEHDEAYQQEQAPTWHARDVVAERARRCGAPCLLVSPCPTLEALAWGELVTPDRGTERASWPRVEVLDQRDLDPAMGPLFSPRLVDLVRGEGRVLCVLNRKGRVRLLACTSCTNLAHCEACDAAVSLADDGTFVCGRCATIRPTVCLSCGGAKFKNLRLGVSRVREELERLAGTPVAEVTASTPDDDPGLREARVLVGTEAVLHRVPRAEAVAFLDFDQELMALRMRTAEEALGLLARAGRVVARGTRGRGTVLVQTRTPDHPVLKAAASGDPAQLVDAELPMRQALGLPPTTAVALVSGPSAREFMERLGTPQGLRVQGPLDERWRIVATDHQQLCDALAVVKRPPGRLRVSVDPLRA